MGLWVGVKIIGGDGGWIVRGSCVVGVEGKGIFSRWNGIGMKVGERRFLRM